MSKESLFKAKLILANAEGLLTGGIGGLKQIEDLNMVREEIFKILEEARENLISVKNLVKD